LYKSAFYQAQVAVAVFVLGMTEYQTIYFSDKIEPASAFASFWQRLKFFPTKHQHL
jgi:hypothetical protein